MVQQLGEAEAVALAERAKQVSLLQRVVIKAHLQGSLLTLPLLLLSHFSHVRLCATPQTAAHQAPPSLGFSGQEHCSGLPFLSPMHESEK